MAAVYRTVASGPIETIVIAPAPRWYALILAIPFVLTFNDAFMHLVAPIPVLEGSGFCGNSARNFGEYMAAQSWAQEVRGLLFLLALGALVFALSTPFLPKTTVVVDRVARVLRVRTKSGEHGVAFAERPVLVQREGAWFIHAGPLPPVRLAARRADAAAIDRLRGALATLERQ